MSTLRPFEAAARHENFSMAAEELFVTQAAISKQIRLLEDHLGVSLFIRRGKNLELTAAGRDLHYAVAHGLNRIAGGSDRLRRENRSNRVTIAMRLPFANHFMVPRLGRLLSEFPEVDFNFQTTDGNPTSLLEYVDFAVVLGHEPQPHILADLLVVEEIAPVCSPDYLRRHPELKTAQNIPDLDLLHLDAGHWRDLPWSQADWSVVLNQFGVAVDKELRGPSFTNFEMLMSAAISGLGVAVAWDHLVDHLIEQGALIYPIEDKFRIGRQHHLLSRESQTERPLLHAIRTWLLDETRMFRA